MTNLATRPLRLSAVIITLNEEKNIERCIRSLMPVADEIVIVDSGSGDRTAEIATALGARVIPTEWMGYSQTKNLANQQALYPFILSLDADEALSEQLAGEIEAVKKQADADQKVYSFNRLTYYCGKPVRHCGWYPDKKIRLFDRSKGQWTGKYVHETFIPEEGTEVIHLKGDLLHYTFYTVEEHRKQTERFSTLAARKLYEENQRVLPGMICIKTLSKFVSGYFFKLGFLDGVAGFQICRISAGSTYKRYKKLKAMQKEKPFGQPT